MIGRADGEGGRTISALWWELPASQANSSYSATAAWRRANACAVPDEREPRDMRPCVVRWLAGDEAAFRDRARAEDDDTIGIVRRAAPLLPAYLRPLVVADTAVETRLAKHGLIGSYGNVIYACDPEMPLSGSLALAMVEAPYVLTAWDAVHSDGWRVLDTLVLLLHVSGKLMLLRKAYAAAAAAAAAVPATPAGAATTSSTGAGVVDLATTKEAVIAGKTALTTPVAHSDQSASADAREVVPPVNPLHTCVLPTNIVALPRDWLLRRTEPAAPGRPDALSKWREADKPFDAQAARISDLAAVAATSISGGSGSGTASPLEWTLVEANGMAMRLLARQTRHFASLLVPTAVAGFAPAPLPGDAEEMEPPEPLEAVGAAGGAESESDLPEWSGIGIAPAEAVWSPLDAWVAPEYVGTAFAREPGAEARDVYAFATTMWALLARRVVSTRLRELRIDMARVAGGAGSSPAGSTPLRTLAAHLPLEELPAEVPVAVRELLERCWATSPDERPSMAQVRQVLAESCEALLSR